MNFALMDSVGGELTAAGVRVVDTGEMKFLCLKMLDQDRIEDDEDADSRSILTADSSIEVKAWPVIRHMLGRLAFAAS